MAPYRRRNGSGVTPGGAEKVRQRRFRLAPGMSAAAMAWRLGIHQHTVAADPDKYVVLVRTYPGGPDGLTRKRYFLRGNEGSGSAAEN